MVEGLKLTTIEEGLNETASVEGLKEIKVSLAIW